MYAERMPPCPLSRGDKVSFFLRIYFYMLATRSLKALLPFRISNASANC